jgi:Flp pilus assembly protein TadD
MDDKFYLGAPEVRNPSWHSLKPIFGEVLAPSIVKGYYQPLALTSIMLDFLDPAAKNNLRPFHRTSLMLHLLNVALVVVLLYLLFGNWMTGCLLGLLYGLHPLNADVVLWIAERKAVLSTCFALWSMVLYVLYAQQADKTRERNWKLFGTSLFMYVCAVLAKPTAVPVAVLLLVLDFWPLKRLNWRTLLEKAPYGIVCGLFALVTVISQSRSFDAGKVEMIKAVHLPFVMAYSLGLYLFKTVWPAGLVYDYPLPRLFSLANPEVLGCVFITLAFVATMAFTMRRTRALLAGGLLFVIAIFPALGIVRFTSSIVSNRFMYLPMVGLLLPINWALLHVWNTARGVVKTRIVLIVTIVALAAGCAVATRNYESQWRDSLTLLQYYLTKSPDDWKLHTRMGNERVERGDLDAAIAEFTEAIRLNPGWAENRLNVGRALFTEGRLPEALEAFTGALRLTPNDWRISILFGATLSRMNNLDGALTSFKTAARLAPDRAEAHFDVAGILAQQGKPDEAVKEYRETLRLDPQCQAAQIAVDSLLANNNPHNMLP